MTYARVLTVAVLATLVAVPSFAQQDLTARPGYEAPVRFGITPGLLGGADPYGFGIEPGGMVPTLVIGPIWGLNLSDEQENKIDAVYSKHRRQQWAFLHQMMSENARLEEIFGDGKWDIAAVGEAYTRIFTLRRERIQAVARTRNAIYEVMTPEQREELRLLREGKTVPPKE